MLKSYCELARFFKKFDRSRYINIPLTKTWYQRLLSQRQFKGDALIDEVWAKPYQFGGVRKWRFLRIWNYNAYQWKICQKFLNMDKSFVWHLRGRKIQVLIRDIDLGVPINFSQVRCSMGSQQSMIYCIFKKEFSEIWGLCFLWDPIFLEIICQKFDTFLDFFLQKINVLRFGMVSNGKILKNFNETPINLHTGHF